VADDQTPISETTETDALADTGDFDNAEELDGQLEDAEEPEPKRDGVRIVGLILLIIALVLILLLLRDCGKPDLGEGDGSKKIVDVPGEHPVPGSVSVWIDAETSLAKAFSGIGYSDPTDLGDGRYVVIVPVGTEEEVVEALREREGVYDAGLVYEDPTPIPAETPDTDLP